MGMLWIWIIVSGLILCFATWSSLDEIQDGQIKALLFNIITWSMYGFITIMCIKKGYLKNSEKQRSTATLNIKIKQLVFIALLVLPALGAVKLNGWITHEFHITDNYVDIGIFLSLIIPTSIIVAIINDRFKLIGVTIQQKKDSEK